MKEIYFVRELCIFQNKLLQISYFYLTCLTLICISFKFQIMIQERKYMKTKKNHKGEDLEYSIFSISGMRAGDKERKRERD